ncbi:hypothetical protein LZG04_03170 [Saccharothrix sp. S26]|uniref:hypothetical protein n=1 Tax=Saccharothrix sp. S26 TaxID=2907215 RepID=UPI001F164034|nr:hypothetical protein [Saccharothrix sp. S26]MCE6993815.1 hypothetical protein [Saccharothrix sp. S26]
MGKNGRRKRRQAAAQVQRSEAWAEDFRARHAARSATRQKRAVADKRLNWFTRLGNGSQVLVALGGITAVVVGHFALWGAVLPALGAAVGRVPVVSTVAGWLFGGGAFLAWGVYAINEKTARPATAQALGTTAWVWSGVACMMVPSSYANDISLPVDFWAGAYASAYGVVATPLALGVVALGWWLLVNKLAGHKEEPSSQAVGWICVGYATLLLVWGSTLLRT